MIKTHDVLNGNGRTCIGQGFQNRSLFSRTVLLDICFVNFCLFFFCVLSWFWLLGSNDLPITSLEPLKTSTFGIDVMLSKVILRLEILRRL